MRRLVLAFLIACGDKDTPKKIDLPVGSGSGQQVKPPIDIKTPPADAIKTPSGLIYKKIKTNPSGVAPARNDTVLINYTGWKHATGETFFTNRSQAQPMPLSLASTAAGFVEAMQLTNKGETVMLWMPPNIGYKGPPQGNAETLVYEVEIVDIVAAPKLPPDYAAPPVDAKVLKSGAKYAVVTPSTEKDKARSFDTVTFDYTAWDSEGRMFDSTEMRKRPATVPPFRQSATMDEILTTMVKGERVRLWVASEQMNVGGQAASGLPAGQLCYELQMISISKAPGEPPPVPADVKAPPANAKKTAKGVSYVVLKTGKGGAKPNATDTVKVSYTAWTTDGRMFESTAVTGAPANLALNGAIAGLTDGIPLFSVGDRVRLWIPPELAYLGAPAKPQGMLVYDLELLEIKTTPVGDPHADHAGPSQVPAPPDVAKPPKGAKQTPKGVFYKVLTAAKPDAHKPVIADIIKVNYTGWTTDGKQFDTSTSTGKPAQFPLEDMIPGWREAVPMMGVGAKWRLWIPENLAYAGQEGSPKGMLVFDIELVEIQP